MHVHMYLFMKVWVYVCVDGPAYVHMCLRTYTIYVCRHTRSCVSSKSMRCCQPGPPNAFDWRSPETPAWIGALRPALSDVLRRPAPSG